MREERRRSGNPPFPFPLLTHPLFTSFSVIPEEEEEEGLRMGGEGVAWDEFLLLRLLTHPLIKGEKEERGVVGREEK